MKLKEDTFKLREDLPRFKLSGKGSILHDNFIQHTRELVITQHAQFVKEHEQFLKSMEQKGK